MSSNEELRKRLNAELNKRLSYDYIDGTGKTKSEISTMKSNKKSKLYQALSERLGNSNYASVNGDYINSFLEDSQNYFKNAQSSSVNYDNAQNMYAQSRAKWSSLKDQADTIRAYYNANEKNLDAKSYSDMISYLDDFDKGSANVLKYYRDNADYYSQWKNKESYDYAVAQNEKKQSYERMTDAELEKAYKETKPTLLDRLSQYTRNVSAAPVSSDSNLPFIDITGYNEKLQKDVEKSKTASLNRDVDAQMIRDEQTRRIGEQYNKLSATTKKLIDEYAALASENDALEMADVAAGLSVTGNTAMQNTLSVDANKRRMKEISSVLDSSGTSNWQSLVNYSRTEKERKETEERNAEFISDMNELGAFGDALGTGVSLVANAGSGIGNLGTISNALGDKYDNQYSSWYGLANLSNAIRQNELEKYNLTVDIPILGERDLFDDLYTTFTSAADSMIAGTAFGNLGGAAIGAQAAVNGYIDALNNGADSTGALITSIANGINETLFETLSIGQFKKLGSKGIKTLISTKGVKTFAGNILKSMGVNATEEFNTEIANMVIDYIVNGGASQYVRNYEQALSEGFTEQEARSIAQKAFAAQAAEAGYGGALQGILMGGTASAIARTVATEVDDRSRGAALKKSDTFGNINEVIKGSNDVDVNTKAKARDIAEALERGEKVSNRDIGKTQRLAFEQMSDSAQKVVTDAVEQRLSELGVKKSDIEASVNVVINAIENRDISDISGNEQKVAAEFLNNEEWAKKALNSQAAKQMGLFEFATAANTAVKPQYYKVATDGKTQLKSGEKVQIKTVSVDSAAGDAKVVLTNGKTVSADDVLFGTNREALAFEALNNLNLPGEQAQLVYEMARESGKSMYKWLNAANEVANLGRNNISIDEVRTQGIASELTAPEAAMVYDLARKYAEENPVRARTRAAEYVGVSFNGNQISRDNIDDVFAGYNDMQKTGAKAAYVISDAAKVNVVLYETKNINGKYEAVVNGSKTSANGWYDPNTNTIYLDVNAGNTGAGTVLFTLSHELTHFINEWSPEKFKVLADFLVNEYGKKNKSVDELVKEQVYKHNRVSENKWTIANNYDDAFEEFVADSMEVMLADPNVADKLQKLAQKDESLVKKILDYIKDFIKQFKALDAYKNASPETEEGRFVKEMGDSLDELQNLFADALASAGKASRGAEVTANYSSNGAAKAQIRESFAKEFDQWDKKNDKKIFVVGTTSKTLQKIGIPKKSITWDGKKIIKIMAEHSEMTADIIKQVPNIIESPIIVMQSKNKDSRITMFGEVYSNNKPVLAVLELTPKGRYGLDLGEIKIASAYGKDNAQNLINTSEVLYVESNKKRINAFGTLTGLQLPVGGVNSIDSIRPSSEKVNKENGKFSLRENVEQTKDLVAVHNITQDELLKSLRLGGLPMPSIAILKAETGHTDYGDVSLVFDKNTIDPQKNKKNKVYGGDAWTPTFPQIEYKARESVVSTIRNKYYDMEKKLGNDSVRPLYQFTYDMERVLTNYGGEVSLLSELYENKGLMNLFLQDKGFPKVEDVYDEKKTELSDIEKTQYATFIENLNKDLLSKMADTTSRSEFLNTFSEYESEFTNAYKKTLRDLYGFSEEELGNITKADVIKEVLATRKFQKNNGVTVSRVYNKKATEKAISDAVDKKEYREWINSLFKGVEEKSGIYNGKDPYYNNGDRKSFEALHYEVNLENIVKAMKQQAEVGGQSPFFGMGLWGIAAKRFNSIDEIRADKERLKTTPQLEYDAIKEAFGNRLTEIANSIMDPNQDNPYIALDEAMRNILEAVLVSKTKSGMLRALKEYNPRATELTVDDIISLVEDVSNMPTEYFEAKPQRAVMFDEVATAIIPSDSSDELKNALGNNGVSFVEYEAGNEEARKDALNSLEGVKFSNRDITFSKALTADEWKKYNNAMTSGVDAGLRINDRSMLVECEKGDYSYKLVIYDNEIEDKPIKAVYGIAKSNQPTTNNNFDEKTIAEYITELEDRNYDNKRVLERLLKSVSKNVGRVLGRYSGGSNRFVRYGREISQSGGNPQNQSDRGRISKTDTQSVKSSERDTEAAADREKVIAQLEKENAELKANFESVKELLALQGKETRGRVFTPKSLNDTARRIMKTYGADGNVAEFAEIINKLYRATATEGTWDDFVENARPAIDWLRKNEKIAKPQRTAEAQEMLNELRGMKFRLTETQKREVESVYGSYNKYRQLMFGKITVSDNANVTLDEVWRELSGLLSGYAAADVNEGDMPFELLGAITAVQETYDDYGRYQELISDQDIIEGLYNGYWDVSVLRTVADKKRREIQQLKAKHNERIAELRRDRNDKIEALKQKYIEQRKQSVESRNKTVIRHQIMSTVKELDSYLNKGTKEHNVKNGMRDMVDKALVLSDLLLEREPADRDVLAMMKESDFSSDEQRKLFKKYRATLESRAGYIERREKATVEQFAELDNMVDVANRKLREIEKSLADAIGYKKNSLNANALSDAIGALYDSYKALENSDVSYIQDAYEPFIADALNTLKTELQGQTLRRMSKAQLEQVHDAYRMVLHSIRDANKAFVNGKRESTIELHDNAVSEIKEVGTFRKTRLKGSLNDFTWQELKPIYAFERIGSKTLKRLFNEIVKGQYVYGMDIAEARDFVADTRKKYGFDKWDFDTIHTFDVDGKKFELDLEHIMSIYAYSRREQAYDHMSIGGFTYDKTEEYGKFLKKIRITSQAYRLNYEDVAKITSTLTEEQAKYVEVMQDYLSDVMGGKGNEVTRTLYGVDWFKEKHYFPLRSERNYLSVESQKPVAAQASLKNAGMTKQLVQRANNPIVLSAFDSVWENHTNQMSMYHGLVVPIDSFNKVYNFKGYLTGTESENVRSTLEGVFGESVTGYINNFLADINGNVVNQGAQNIFEGLFSKFKKTAVAASLSTAIQQPTAIIRATSVIPPKYFIGITKGKHAETWETIKKWAPVAVIKEIGGFDVGGRTAKEYLDVRRYDGAKDKAIAMVTDSNYRDSKFSVLAEEADVMGWNTIWKAAERYVADTTEWVKGSDEFYKAVANKFNEAIEYTQVYDSVISRSGYMRSKNGLVKVSTAFMGEPTTSANMMYNAILQAKRKTISPAKAAGTVAVVMAASFAAAAARSLIYALRDDDEDEAYVDKYIEKLTANLIDEAMVWNLLPFVSDLAEMLNGKDVGRTDLTLFDNIITEWQNVTSGKYDGKPYQAVEKLGGSFAAFFGLPLGNLLRTGREIFNIFKFAFDDAKSTAESARKAVLKGANKEKAMSDANKYLERGKTDKAKDVINGLINDKVAGGKTRKEALGSIKSSLTAYWKPKYIEADWNERNEIRKKLYSTGVYDSLDALDKIVSNWLKDKE